MSDPAHKLFEATPEEFGQAALIGALQTQNKELVNVLRDLLRCNPGCLTPGHAEAHAVLARYQHVGPK